MSTRFPPFFIGHHRMQLATVDALATLEEKINDKSALVGIYGLGYVGLPLALRFAEVGLKVLGFDPVRGKPCRSGQGQERGRQSHPGGLDWF